MTTCALEEGMNLWLDHGLWPPISQFVAKTRSKALPSTAFKAHELDSQAPLTQDQVTLTLYTILTELTV